MESKETLIAARMSLSVRSESRQLECAFSFSGKEFRTATTLFSDRLLTEHRKEIDLATQGYSRSRSESVRSVMERELRRVIPRQAIVLLRDAIMKRPETATLALEIMLNDALILECYPWELLSKPGLLVDRSIAVVVWRSVYRAKLARRPSSAVLLVGSASLDTISTNATEEIAHLAKLVRNHGGIHPHPHASITFRDFTQLLSALEPSVIHIVTHGDIRGLQFQEEEEFSRSHYDIPSQELAGYLAASSTANLVVLNACDSANPWEGRTPVARQIATESALTAVGMATEVPNLVGAEFSESFFTALLCGFSMIEAFGRAVQIVRRTKKFSTLWSVPIMYAPPGSNVILFPSDSLGRIRLQFQDLHRQLQQLESEAGAFVEQADIASGVISSLGTAAIRLAYIGDLVDEIESSALREREYLYSRLRLRQTCVHARRKLEDLDAALSSLRDQRQPRDRRVRTVRSITLTLHEQGRLFTQIEQAFAGSR
jgi:hypothetical protein